MNDRLKMVIGGFMAVCLIVGFGFLMIWIWSPTEMVVCSNKTTIINSSTIIIKTLPCEQTCPICNPIVKTINNKDTEKKLINCNIRLDFLNKELFDCLDRNTSKRYEKVNESLKDCQNDNKKLQDRLHNISRFV